MESTKAILLLYLNIDMIKKIKVVVPTLNTYKILPKLVNSLKKQTWKDWNLLFVDGDSEETHYQYLLKSCKDESRLKILKQQKDNKGIYGAMNQGFETIKENELILFWGSDDWAISSNVFENIVKKVNSYSKKFDLIVCKGIYVDKKSNKLSRVSNFFNSRYSNILDKGNFRKKLFLGMTPPHQATFFSKKAFVKLMSFSDNLVLASDLDYFLRFSKIENISILVIDYDLVYMSTSGISSQKSKLRLFEVLFSYMNSFGIFFLIPFILRYLRKISLKLNRRL